MSVFVRSLACLLSFYFITHMANAQSLQYKHKIEYYMSALSEFDGKVKSIDGTSVDYYLSALSEFNGKIKSIGNARIDYYVSAIGEIDGKLKSIGNIEFSYNFDGTAHDNYTSNSSYSNDAESALNLYWIIERINSRKSKH